ncbi:MAG: AAA family ATPase [Burkholderiaceae bacterium]|nr:AAA family ATPase [Burkholderiaceae bacterium]
MRFDDGRVLPLSAREAVLLAWLHLEGPTPRAVVAGRLWPAGDDGKARANLRQTLLRLKRAAGDVLAESEGILRLAPDVIVAPPGDAAGLHRLLGPLEFDDAPELAEWLQSRRDALERERQRERLRQAQALLDVGDSAGALAVADALLAADAAVEEAHRLRMQALFARGDRAAAIAAWDECRLALRRAFGIAPSAATNELGRTILASESAEVEAPLPRAMPEALRRPPQLIGREDVLRSIANAFAQGYGVVVAGPGGVGKSRVLAEAMRAMQPAIRVGGRPGDAVLPGALASRLVAAAIARFDPALDATTRADIARLLPGGPDHGQALQSALEHRRVLASVARTMLACHARGMRLVVVDDLQFADDVSIAAIGVVIGGWLANPPDSAALPLFGCRPDELRPPAAELVQMLQGSRRGVRIDLAPLSAGDVLRLLDTLPLQVDDPEDLGAALYARVGGNPAFLLESIKALWPDGLSQWKPGTPLPVPETLVDSVRQRLTRLSGEALQLAQLASVAQSDFSLSLTSVAFNRAPLALAPLFAALEAAQVLDVNGFSHDLVAEAVERSLPASLRAPLHRLVAEHLGANDAPPASVAAHWQAAGDMRAAARWHLRAGDHARHRWQHLEAATSYEAALAGLDRVSQRADCLRAGRDAARSWLWLSRHGDASRVLDQVEALALGAAERVMLATVRALLHYNARAVDAAVPIARALADDLLASATQLAAEDINQALRAIAVVLPMVREDGRALEVVDRMASQIDLARPEIAVDYHLVRGGLLYRIDRPKDALPDLRAAFGGARHLGLRGPLVAAGGELMRSLQALGQAREALAVGESTLAAAIDGGFGPGFEFELRGQIAMLLFALGQPGPAWQQVDAAEAAHARSGRPDSDVMLKAMVRAMAGATEEAQSLLGRHAPVAEGRVDVHGEYLARVQSRIALARGEDASPALARATGFGARSLSHQLQCAAAGPAPSMEQAEQWLDAARASGEAALQRGAHMQRARSHLAAGDRKAAAADVQAALALADAIDPWFDDTARRWADAGELLAACGEKDGAAAVVKIGACWVHAAAKTLSDPQHARAWLGHAVHRRLVGG